MTSFAIPATAADAPAAAQPPLAAMQEQSGSVQNHFRPVGLSTTHGKDDLPPARRNRLGRHFAYAWPDADGPRYPDTSPRTFT